MMFVLYDFFFIVFAIIYFPYMLVRGKWHREFGMRFGLFPQALRKQLQCKRNIWIHAVSVGEVMAVKRFVQELQKRFPDRQIVISTVTITGQALARKQFPEACVLYAPLDFSLSVCAYIRAIAPECYIAAETEIWPNIFYFLNRRKIPVIQVNGRISDKSYPGYKRFAFIIKHILSCVRCFCVQTDTDARRLMDIGADPGCVFVTGNMKFDDSIHEESRAYGQIFNNDQGRVLVAGSTHPGEEIIVLKVFQRLKEKFHDISLVLAPRHIERIPDVELLIKSYGLGYTKFSDFSGSQIYVEDILLVDTIGHLKNLYACADVVFIGKSLTGKGGQNIIEPALFGKAVIVGPHTENFRSTVDLFKNSEALVVVSNEGEFFLAVQDLFDHPDQALEIGAHAKEIAESQKGAVIKTIQRIQPFLHS